MIGKSSSFQVANRVNLAGMVLFVMVFVVFNISFWLSVMNHQSRSAKDFLLYASNNGSHENEQ